MTPQGHLAGQETVKQEQEPRMFYFVFCLFTLSLALKPRLAQTHSVAHDNPPTSLSKC